MTSVKVPYRQEPIPLGLPPAEVVEFFAPGVPAPQGSKSFKGMRGGHAILAESSKKVGPWRTTVSKAAMVAMSGRVPMTGAARARFEFVLHRPVSTPKRATPPAIKYPDVDKLARAIFDSLGGVVVANDSQIVDVHAVKRLAEIGEATGVYVRVESVL